MKHIKNLEKWFIDVSFGQSTLRNNGSGIAQGIRYELQYAFSTERLMEHLIAGNYESYLNKLTKKVVGKPGRDPQNIPTPSEIPWGSARKCINLLARTVVYNGFIWNAYKLKVRDFSPGGFIDQLELPLDSYCIKGIKDDCDQYQIDIAYPEPLKKFTIIGLTAPDSKKIQRLAAQIAERRKMCRIDLDISYWRKRVAGS